jgi:hypothetical protein
MSKKGQAAVVTETSKMDTNNPGASPTMNSGLQDGFRRLHIKPSDIACEYLDTEVLTRKGAMLFYINMNSFGATTMIGGTRTGIVDPRRIPEYLARNRSAIRSHAVQVLQQHFRDTHCSTGATERLTADDYSISFSFASISDEGRKLNKDGLNELPLMCADSPYWVVPSQPGPDEAPVYVVNCYIQLQEANKRIGAVLKRHAEDAEAKAEAAKRPRPYPMGQRFGSTQETITATAAAVADQFLKRQAPPTPAQSPDQIYPYLPPGAPGWNTSGKSPLPSE